MPSVYKPVSLSAVLCFAGLLVISSTCFASSNTIEASQANVATNNEKSPPLAAADVSSVKSLPLVAGTVLNAPKPVKSGQKKVDNRKRSARLFGHKKQASPQLAPLEAFSQSYVDPSSLVAQQIIAGDPASLGDSQNQVQAANDASNFASYASHLMAGNDQQPPPVARQSDYLGQQSSYSTLANPSQQASKHQYYHHANKHHHHQARPLGYPERAGDEYLHDFGQHQAAGWPLGFESAHHGLISSASSMLSHWTGGFGLAEIVCGIVAVALGAVILGAPFFLIYLALMGNFSGSGTLSLANPMQNTTANVGRRKRAALWQQVSLKQHYHQHNRHELGGLLDEAVGKLSPLLELDQVAKTFKILVSAIEKYSAPGEN